MVRRVLAWSSVLAAACCVVIPVLLRSLELGPMRAGGFVAFVTSDWFQYALPHWQYAAWMLGHGTMPLWNPYQLCGAPYLAVQNHGMLYPPNWLMLVLPVPQAMRVVFLAHYALAMGGAYAAARAFGAARAGSLLAGVSYALGGTLTAQGFFGSPAILTAAAWLPWQLALTRWTLRSKAETGVACALALGGVTALSFIGGQPQFVVMGIHLCAAYALAELGLIASRSGLRAALHRGSWLLLAAGFATGVAAIQLFPTAELLLRTTRAPGVLAASQGFDPLPDTQPLSSKLAGLLSPVSGEFGVQAPEHLGILPMVLAPIAVFWAWRRGLFFWVIALLSWLAALGGRTPVFGWYVSYLPAAGLFRVPQRLLMVTVLMLSLASALGLQGLQQSRRLSQWAGCAAIALASLMALAFAARASIDAAAMNLLPVCLALVVLWLALHALPAVRRGSRWRTGLAALGVLGTICELHGATELRYAHPANQPEALHIPTAAAAFIREHQGTQRTFAPDASWIGRTNLPEIPPKLGMLTGIASITDFENLIDQRYVMLLDALLHDPPVPRWAAKLRGLDERQLALLRVLGVRFVMLPGDAPLTVNLPVVLNDGYYRVYEIPDPLPRAFIATQVHVEADPLRAFVAMSRTPQMLLDRSVVIEDASLELPGESSGSVDVEVDEPMRVSLRAHADSAGLVILSDQLDPWWAATVDGQRAAILRANWVFRAVRIEAGDHVIRFVYRPWPYYAGAALTFVSVLAALLALARHRRSGGSSVSIAR
jgi:hypothetical protein